MDGSSRTRAIFLGAIVLGLPMAAANAQFVVDGTGGDIPDAVRQEVFELVTENFRDPLTSQFRRLHRASAPNRYCGEVNTRNMYGAYGGFKPFLVVLDDNNKSVEMLPLDEGGAKPREADQRAKLAAMKNAGCRFGAK